MYATLAEFQAALLYSHTVVLRADVLRRGVVVATGLRVVAGSVSVDGSAAVRRRCRLSVVDPTGDLIPTGKSIDALTPYGNELQVYRGIRLAGGDELVPQGVFRIARAEVIGAADGGVLVDVTGYDRSRSVARNKFIDPYQITAGQNYGTAIQNLLESRVPGGEYLFDPVLATTPQLIFDAEADPWAKARDMAASIGCELLFDVQGRRVLRAVPDSSTAPIAATYAEGADAIATSITRTFDDEPGHNGVIVTGETTSNTAPVRGEWWDDDPTSPTYYLGDYGPVPRFEHSPYVTDQTQADLAAAAIGRQLLGVTEQAQWTSVPHPGHDAGDVVRLRRAAMGLDDFYVLDSFDMPLGFDGLLSGTSRKRKTAAA